jgi:hypothetical protein
MAKAKDGDEIVSASELARRLGLTQTSVSRLGGDGVLVRGPGRDEYKLWPSVAGYVEHLRRSSRSRASPAPTTRAKLLGVQAERQTHALQVERGAYIPVTEAVATQCAILRVACTRFRSLPARLSGLFASLSRGEVEGVRIEIDAILTDLGNNHAYPDHLYEVAMEAIEGADKEGAWP